MSEDALDIQKFIDLGQECVYIKPLYGQNRKSVKKSLKKLMKGRYLNPLGIVVWGKTVSDLDELVEQLIDNENTVYLPVTGKVLQKLGEDVLFSEREWVVFEALRVRKGRDYYNSLVHNKGLETVLKDAWLDVRRHRGALQPNCDNCDNTLEVNGDDCCNWCGYDIDVSERPKTLAGIYEVIATYEAESGKQVLERV